MINAFSHLMLKWYSICSQSSCVGAMRLTTTAELWKLTKGRVSKGAGGSTPQMQNSEICPGRNYLYMVHIFQQLSKGVELHQWDQLSAWGRLRLRLFIDYRTQRRQLQVGVFLWRMKKNNNKYRRNKRPWPATFICTNLIFRKWIKG